MSFQIEPRGHHAVGAFFTWYRTLSEAAASFGPGLVPSECPAFEFRQSDVGLDKGSEEISHWFYSQTRKDNDALARVYLAQAAHSRVTVRYARASSSDPYYWVDFEVDGKLWFIREYQVVNGELGAIEPGFDKDRRNFPPEISSGGYDHQFWWKTETFMRSNANSRVLTHPHYSR